MNATDVMNQTIALSPVMDPQTAITTSIISAVASMAVVITLLYLPRLSMFSNTMKMKKEIKNMAKITNRPILVLAHNDAGIFGGMIMPSTIVKLAKEMRKFNGKDFDFVIHTLGGDLFSSVKIAKMIRDYPGNVNVMVPKYAMSGGTMIALGADSIEMDENASLGPVDPQIGGLFSTYSSKAWKQILKVKGKKADDKSIATSLLAKQVDDMVRSEIENITGRKNIDFLFRGDVAHSMQFDKKFMRNNGFPIKDMKLEHPHRIIEANCGKEVMSFVPRVKT